MCWQNIEHMCVLCFWSLRLIEIHLNYLFIASSSKNTIKPTKDWHRQRPDLKASLWEGFKWGNLWKKHRNYRWKLSPNLHHRLFELHAKCLQKLVSAKLGNTHKNIISVCSGISFLSVGCLSKMIKCFEVQIHCATSDFPVCFLAFDD